MATKKTKKTPRAKLRALFLKARTAGLKKGERPRTMAWFAAKSSVERTYLYALLSGAKYPSDDVIRRLARGLGLGERGIPVVTRAL